MPICKVACYRSAYCPTTRAASQQDPGFGSPPRLSACLETRLSLTAVLTAAAHRALECSLDSRLALPVLRALSKPATVTAPMRPPGAANLPRADFAFLAALNLATISPKSCPAMALSRH
jgi:hypothetical protein